MHAFIFGDKHIAVFPCVVLNAPIIYLNTYSKVAEADKAEAEAEKAKVDAERSRFELEELKKQAQEKASQTVENLTRAAVPLNIKPPANNIIDITALFQIDDETE